MTLSHGRGYALGYVDFIDRSLSRAEYQGPQLPLLFNFSGNGSYILPFYLDTRDPLISQLDYICHESQQTNQTLPDAWSKFVRNLNSNMRGVNFV